MFKIICFIAGLVCMAMVLVLPVVTFYDVCYVAFFLVTGMVYFCLASRKGDS